MADRDAKTHACPLFNGNYKATGSWYSGVVINGCKGILKEPTNAGIEVKIMIGDFGEADPEIVKSTGQKICNIRFSVSFGKEMHETGVISKDGLRITVKGMMGMTELEWITEEEAAALEAKGEPIDAPPGDYKIQPEYQGKLLWITGAPGLGKSTTAQLLGRNHGYVYYEGDCFGNFVNPYIPLNADDPTMALVHQKPLKGEGAEKRAKICKEANDAFMMILNGEELGVEEKKRFYAFYSCMCADILRERKRIGGDWAIATCAFTRVLRDHIRSVLGPDLIFVILSMDEEEVRKRVTARHHGEEQAAEMVEPISKLCEPIGDDEEQAVSVTVTTDMTREEVIDKILDIVK